ncbi:hypothetical protein [Epilithonimonas hungarica]|uniref:hypothetical protein n=1 Tax=Epilithonimonas hungarica TaxID=454006 RepID=UPI0027D91BBB|nr:hypothetical protein [Epilithonimonas hungarica]
MKLINFMEEGKQVVIVMDVLLHLLNQRVYHQQIFILQEALSNAGLGVTLIEQIVENKI